MKKLITFRMFKKYCDRCIFDNNYHEGMVPRCIDVCTEFEKELACNIQNCPVWKRLKTPQ